jgi:hypothetical protein
MRAERILIGLLALALAASPPAAAQDAASLGESYAVRGGVAAVPIVVKDVEGTPLGEEYVFGQNIQGFAFQVKFEPAESVASAVIERSGVLTGLTPYELNRSSGNTVSYLASVSEGAQRVRGLAGEGGEVARVVVQISSSAPPGSRIDLSFIPERTMLSNTAGTVLESPARGGLQLTNGFITINDEPEAVTLSIRAKRANASEKKRTSGKIIITRSRAVGKQLPVKLGISGTAKNGVDYVRLPKRVIFTGKRRNITLDVTPLPDNRKEPAETAVVTLKESPRYFVMPPASAAVTIK